MGIKPTTETLISFFHPTRPMRSRKDYTTDSLGRVRYKGKLANKEKREEYVKQNFRAFTDKRGRISVRRPNGQFASKDEISVFRKVVRVKPVIEKLTPVKGVWSDGKVLKSAYYFNFFCVCIVREPRKSPITYVEDGKYIREHFFGFATKSLKNVISRAKAKHNKNFPTHENIEFRMIEKKRMSV